MSNAYPTPAAKRSRHQYYLHARPAENLSPTIPIQPLRSNLGPLTSVFTPPPSCSVAALDCPTCSTAWRGAKCQTPDALNQTIVDDTQCWPTTTTPPPGGFAGFGFYSPGLTCPDGYTSACTAVSQTSNDPISIATPAPYGGDFQFPLELGETAVGCCPSGYGCAVYPGYGWQSCLSVATSALTVMDCGSRTLTDARLQTLQTPSAVQVWAPLVQINWRSSDRPSSTVAPVAAADPPRSYSSTVSAMHISTTPSLSLPTLTASAPPSQATSTPGLSTTAKAGISVAVVSAILLFLSFPLFFYVRRRRRCLVNQNPYNSGSSKVLSLSAFVTPIGNPQATSHKHSAIDSVLDLDKREGDVPKKIRIDTGGFGTGLKVEDALESPIDGGSPFRLTSFPGQLEIGEGAGNSEQEWENNIRSRKGSRS